VRVEVLEGRRPVRDMPVSGVFETYLGTPAYVRMDVLNRMMGERPAVSGAHLAVDSARTAELNAALKELPVVSAVTSRRAAVQKFHDTMAETMLIFVGFFTAFSCMLAFGVTYNSTRVALSERARELATLRVLGVTRMEISYILLGEMALLTLLGLPIGCLTGYGISWLMTTQFETELYRVPLLIEDTTYGWSMLICLAATVVSAALVRRRLDRLDLISVLKTRE
jgi:putative ABC transport system permease protein